VEAGRRHQRITNLLQAKKEIPHVVIEPLQKVLFNAQRFILPLAGMAGVRGVDRGMFLGDFAGYHVEVRRKKWRRKKWLKR
jgi:hypothetical protein